MKKIAILFYAFMLIGFCAQAQTNILVYTENFENGAPTVALNTTDLGSNTGSNMWIINNTYIGAPLYPNTTDESVTVGGTISFAPTSNYLHIYNQPSGITSCNYDPTAASDRFVRLTSGICTRGMSDVKLTFFYLCQGSSTAYGEIYYSVDGGAWTSTGSQYSNQTIWQYTILQNPAFNNVNSLRFGIRWVNDAGTPPGVMSFGIDDIFVTGFFDNFVTNFNVIIDSVIPNPICQNFNPTIYYHLTVPICGSGFYEVQLSNAAGSFTTPTILDIYMFSNSTMTGIIPWSTIPSNTPPGSCYKIRIHYYFTDYSLNFYSNSSPCFVVQQCPNTVSTLQPVVTMSSDSLCVGSVIDVPFYSTGVFLATNKYIAQLSDSNGLFAGNLNILGSATNSTTYDPALGSSPGSVSGLVNENNQPIPDGCNYYIRVVSTNPAAIGTTWGPFCIKHCDIQTNHTLDIHACLTSTQGYDTTIYANIHFYDSIGNVSIYNPLNNQFMLEVHSSQNFAVIPPLGGLGSITADNDTTLTIHIPNATLLGTLGLQPGLYYLRIVATNSNHPWDVNGSLIRLLIGAPADDLWIWQDPPDSVLCVGDAIYFYPIPYNSGPPMNSTYQWYLNGSLFSSEAAIGILFNGAGNYNLTVQETNYGCAGPIVPNSVSLQVLAPPTVAIIGLTQVCMGDTIYYHVTFHPNYYYSWTVSGGQIIDTANNELYVLFDAEGVYTIDLLVLNRCGQAIGHRNIIVTAHPDASFSIMPDTICAGNNVVINATGISPSPLIYAWDFDGGTANPGGNSPGPHDVSWNIPGLHSVLLNLSRNGCHTKDSNYIYVKQKPVPNFNADTVCFGTPSVFTDNTQGNPHTSLWNFGDGSPTSSQANPTHLYSNPGNYNVQLIVTNGDCADTLAKTVVVNAVPTTLFTADNPACLGAEYTVNYNGNAPSNAVYNWNFSDATVLSGYGQGPYTIMWNNPGTFSISLSVTQNSCPVAPTVDSILVQSCLIIIPNIITPNGDGENDVFKIKGLESFRNSQLFIYNRWGKLIYKNNDYKSDWDGGSHADGVYFYVLVMKSDKSYNGTLTLMR